MKNHFILGGYSIIMGGEQYESHLQSHLEQSTEQLGGGVGNRPEPREGTCQPAKQEPMECLCLDFGAGTGAYLASGSLGG